MAHTLTKDAWLLMLEGREYRVAFMREADGNFEVVDFFWARDDAGANAYAKTYFGGQEWYVLDSTGRNINGGPQ